MKQGEALELTSSLLEEQMLQTTTAEERAIHSLYSNLLDNEPIIGRINSIYISHKAGIMQLVRVLNSMAVRKRYALLYRWRTGAALAIAAYTGNPNTVIRLKEELRLKDATLADALAGLECSREANLRMESLYATEVMLLSQPLSYNPEFNRITLT